MKNLARDEAMKTLNKVPEVTLYFWIIKIMATTVGETAADFLNVDLSFGLTGTSLVMAGLLSVFLFMQMRAQKYVPWLYWVNVVLISIAGTLLTDNLVDNFGVALETTTALFGLALLVTFALWYASEKTLSIHSIFTNRRERFYWTAILFTFALGTAAGDLVAESMKLGYLNSAFMFAAMIGAVAVAYYGFKANAVAAFWIAYILTRPLGASLGDWLSQPISDGGLGLGAVTTSVAFLTIILSLVVFLSISRKVVRPRVVETMNAGTLLFPMNDSSQHVLNKVPEVTLIFWIIKIAATTLGETGGDAVSMSMDLGYLLGTGIFAVLFLVAVAAQIRAKRFHPYLYWMTIIATTTVGTTLADYADRSLGIGYTGGVVLLFVLLMASLAVWYNSLGSVSVDSVGSPKSEMFYWVTIMFSQTLGTALGDWTADTAGLGYGTGAIVFGALLLIVVAAYLWTRISHTVLFWTAFILTRPLGAVVGDFLDKPVASGGLALSRYTASGVLLAFIVLCITLFRQRPARHERPGSFNEVSLTRG